jgi:hypothetical protein
MEVKQIRFSNSMGKFINGWIEKYPYLTPYKTPKEPTVFIGMYKRQDYEELMKQKYKSIIIWRGTDANLYLGRFSFFRNLLLKHKNIACSEIVYRSLRAHNIPSIILPLSPTNPNGIYQPCEKGDKIYYYGNKKQNEKYGFSILQELKGRLPQFEFIETNYKTYTKEELVDIYKKCFIGLRLTKKDGLPNTVLELGLMGRKSIYNGSLPHAIKYKNIEDITKSILKEFVLKKDDTFEISQDYKKFLSVDNKWMEI